MSHIDAQLRKSHVIETEALPVSDPATKISTTSTLASAIITAPSSGANMTAPDAVESQLSPQKSTSKAAVASVSATALAPQKLPPIAPMRQLWALNKPDVGWLALGLLGATVVGVASTLEGYIAVHFLVRLTAQMLVRFVHILLQLHLHTWPSWQVPCAVAAAHMCQASLLLSTSII
jgi:hypothetical protein